MEKTNTKNVNFTKVTIIMLIVTMIALIALSSTYAKYTSATNGTGVAVVAKWDFTAELNGVAETDQTINLYDTMDTTVGEEYLLEDYVAPGTSGHFDVVVSSKSQVGTLYTISITPKSGTYPTNMKWYYEDSELTTEKTPLVMTEGSTGIQVPETFIEAGDTAERTITIYWEWPFEAATADAIAATDAVDTADGITADTYTFDIAVTGTQAEPQP